MSTDTSIAVYETIDRYLELLRTTADTDRVTTVDQRGVTVRFTRAQLTRTVTELVWPMLTNAWVGKLRAKARATGLSPEDAIGEAGLALATYLNRLRPGTAITRTGCWAVKQEVLKAINTAAEREAPAGLTTSGRGPGTGERRRAFIRTQVDPALRQKLGREPREDELLEEAQKQWELTGRTTLRGPITARDLTPQPRTLTADAVTTARAAADADSGALSVASDPLELLLEQEDIRERAATAKAIVAELMDELPSAAAAVLRELLDEHGDVRTVKAAGERLGIRKQTAAYHVQTVRRYAARRAA